MKFDPQVLEYIEQFSPDFQKIMFRLRELIYQVVPEAEESVKWRVANFSFNDKPVCYIAGFTHHVTFAFHDGTVILTHPELLEGRGKLLRHIKLKSVEDIDENQIKIWILETFYV